MHCRNFVASCLPKAGYSVFVGQKLRDFLVRSGTAVWTKATSICGRVARSPDRNAAHHSLDRTDRINHTAPRRHRLFRPPLSPGRAHQPRSRRKALSEAAENIATAAMTILPQRHTAAIRIEPFRARSFALDQDFFGTIDKF